MGGCMSIRTDQLPVCCHHIEDLLAFIDAILKLLHSNVEFWNVEKWLLEIEGDMCPRKVPPGPTAQQCL